MPEVNKRIAPRNMVEVAGFNGTKAEEKAVTAVATKTSERDGNIQSKDKVFVADSTFAAITVPTACLALSMLNCKNCTLIVDRVMTVLEVVSCKNVTIKFTQNCKNLDISKSSDVLLDYSEAQEIEELKDINVVTESWSQVKIGYKQGDRMIEKSLPTKIDHKISLEDNELKVETSPSALA